MSKLTEKIKRYVAKVPTEYTGDFTVDSIKSSDDDEIKKIKINRVTGGDGIAITEDGLEIKIDKDAFFELREIFNKISEEVKKDG